MRRTKITIALIMTVAVLLGAMGCSKKLTRQDFISGLESYGIEKTDDVSKVTATLVRGGGTVYYVARDKEEAGKLSNTVMNRFNERDEIKAVDFVLAVVMESGSNDRLYNSFACYLAFDSSKEAEKAYNGIVDAYGDMENGKTGQRSGVTYCIDSGVSGAKTNKIGTGIYLQGNTVIFLNTSLLSRSAESSD